MTRVILWVVLVLSTAGWLQAPDVPVDVQAALETVTGIKIVSVEADDERLRIVYITREIDEVGYRAEILDVYRAVGQALPEDETRPLRLITMIGTDEGLEQVDASSEDVRALLSGEMTRSAFLETLIVIPLEHTSPGSGPGGDI